MKKYFSLFLLSGVLIACDKDKFETKPQLKIKSTNVTAVPFNSTFVVTLEFTDKEGDVSDSLFVIRERTNVRFPAKPPTIEFAIPEFPSRTQGEFQVSFDYQLQLINGLSSIPVPGNPSQRVPDSLTFKFVAKDKQGNLSDTAVLNNIVVQRR